MYYGVSPKATPPITNLGGGLQEDHYGIKSMLVDIEHDVACQETIKNKK